MYELVSVGSSKVADVSLRSGVTPIGRNSSSGIEDSKLSRTQSLWSRITFIVTIVI